MPFKVFKAETIELIGYPIVVIAVEGPERGLQTRTVDSFVMMVEPVTGKVQLFQFRSVAYAVPEMVVSNEVVFLNERFNAAAVCQKFLADRRKALGESLIPRRAVYNLREVDPGYLLCVILQNQWKKESLRIQTATECKELKSFLSKDTAKWSITAPVWISGEERPAADQPPPFAPR